MKYKRYCKTLLLEQNHELISAYKRVHAPGASWPEISKGMKDVGILDMEIYIYENRLFMIMDTTIDFEHEKAMKELGNKARQAEWEAYVSQFQKTSENASAAEKWQLMERIYEIDQQEEYAAIDGQIKESNK